MISEETIQAIRDRVNIKDVIGERVKLTQKGNRLVGLCPFHKEKTPSFNVNEERGFYYCFGCHASGDSIKFVQETEGLSFLETIRELAQRTGIELEESRSADERKRHDEAKRRREALVGASRAAAEYFQRCLEQHPLRALALDELARRGLLTHEPGSGPRELSRPGGEQGRELGHQVETLRAFGVGYAPYGWDGLADHLRQSGFSPQVGESLGLIAPRKSGGGHYDRFRHRLMFAVLDLRGNVVGFSGRSLPEPDAELLRRAQINSMGVADEPAKYINSPESPIYRKREIVFGLYQARSAIRSANECIVVEGNFDVVSLYARGLQNVVAPLGTAFTREQAAQIKRYSNNVTLLFDGDKAGQRACIAAREPTSEEGLLARVARLPEGTDPDDLARAQGVEAVRQCVRNAKGMLEYQIESELDSGFRAGDPQTQGRKIQQVLELIRQEDDPTTRALARSYADTVAARLGISDVRSLQALQRAISNASRRKPSPRPEQAADFSDPAREEPSRRSDQSLEQSILGALLEFPALRDEPEVRKLLPFTSGELALGIATLARWGQRLHEAMEHLSGSLHQVAAQRLAAPELPDLETAREVLLTDLGKLRRQELRDNAAETKELIRRAREEGNLELEMALLKELQERHRRGEVKAAESPVSVASELDSLSPGLIPEPGPAESPTTDLSS